MTAIELRISFPQSFPPGSAVEVASPGRESSQGEVLHICEEENEIYYYIHFFNKDKLDDDWIPAPRVSLLRDFTSIKRLSDADWDQSHSLYWPGFFNLSNFSKQSKSSSKGSTAASASMNHDPYEFSPKTIIGILYGKSVRMKSWYRSPYPRQFWSAYRYLNVCDSCLNYGHIDPLQHICEPRALGRIIYLKDSILIREIDGQEYPAYCERLFLLSKLFLEDKRTSGDDDSQSSQVTPFLFYVLSEVAEDGVERFVGYFSKYKVQKRDLPILSCILVLPSEQKKGYGKLLISVAYELSKREGRQGSAERPLSGPGLAAFMSWWSWRLREVVSNCFEGERLTVGQLSKLSGMTCDDVVETLKHCGALRHWGSGSGADIKLRESGKRAVIRMTMEVFRALEKRSPSGRIQPNEFSADYMIDLK
jgi:histone acetyltransferase MYST1